jgi:transcriptional regulator with XRE-family HTH domain
MARDVTELRRAGGWTQAKMAELLKASEKSVRRWQAGEVTPQAGWRSELARLAKTINRSDLAERIAPNLDRQSEPEIVYRTLLPKLTAVLVANTDGLPRKEYDRLWRLWREMWRIGRRLEKLHIGGEIRARSVSRLAMLTHIFDPFFAKGRDLAWFYSKEGIARWRETNEKLVAERRRGRLAKRKTSAAS